MNSITSSVHTPSGRRPRLLNLLAVVFSLGMVSCNGYGEVQQGKVVSFDAEAGTFSMVLDISKERGKVDYSGVPATQYHMPEDKNEIGAAPTAGLLLDIDFDRDVLKVYDPASQTIREIPYTAVEEKADVNGKNALVYDESAKKARPMPTLDNASGTLTTYLKERKRYLVAKLAPEIVSLPLETFRSGDEARIYYHQAPQVLRFMNVTRTDIFSK